MNSDRILVVDGDLLEQEVDAIEKTLIVGGAAGLATVTVGGTVYIMMDQ